MTIHTPEKIREYVNNEVKDFVDSLTNTDLMVVVILRFHLLTEYLLERIIESELPKGYIITKYSYHQKLEIVNALNILDDNIIRSLQNLNKVRNECSHTRKMKISQENIDKIGTPLGKDFKNIKIKYKADFYSVAIHTLADLYQKLLTQTLRSENTEFQL